MAKPVLNATQFQTEQGAFAYVEARLWPTGPRCARTVAKLPALAA